MGGDELGRWVVSRVLHGGKLVDFIFLRHNHHAGGVLTCGSLNAHAALYQPLFLRVAALNMPLFQILADIAVGGLVCQSAYRAGTENVTFAK